MYVGMTNPRWRGKRFQHSRRMRNPWCYVSGKKPILQGAWWSHCRTLCKISEGFVNKNEGMDKRDLARSGLTQMLDGVSIQILSRVQALFAIKINTNDRASIFHEMSHSQISQSLEFARLGVKMLITLQNFAGVRFWSDSNQKQNQYQLEPRLFETSQDFKVRYFVRLRNYLRPIPHPRPPRLLCRTYVYVYICPTRDRVYL